MVTGLACSAPVRVMALGAGVVMMPSVHSRDVAAQSSLVMRWLGRRRMPRKPISMIECGAEVCFTIMREDISRLGLTMRQLACVGVMMRALQAYYSEIGDRMQAQIWADMLGAVDAEADLLARMHAKTWLADWNEIADEVIAKHGNALGRALAG